LPADFCAGSNLEKMPQSESPRGNGELVLVIDDEATIRPIIQKTLETFGYRVVTASGGPKGLSIYVHQQAEIAAVITDRMIPIMGGVAIINALLRVNSKAKVIVITALSPTPRSKQRWRREPPSFLPNHSRPKNCLRCSERFCARPDERLGVKGCVQYTLNSTPDLLLRVSWG
jgi:CheY-like chemotaxis protein